MDYVLIVWFVFVNAAGGMTSAEFSSETACEQARELVLAEMKKRMRGPGQFKDAVCVPKQ